MAKLIPAILKVWMYLWKKNRYTSCLEYPLTPLPVPCPNSCFPAIPCVAHRTHENGSAGREGEMVTLVPPPPEGTAAPARSFPEQAQTGWAHRKEVMVCSPALGQANPCMQASLLARSSHLVAWICKLPSGYLFDQPHVMTLR